MCKTKKMTLKNMVQLIWYSFIKLHSQYICTVLQDRSWGAEAAAGPAEAGEHPGPRRVAQSCQGDDSSLHPAARLAWVAILVFTAPIGDGYARRNPFLQLWTIGAFIHCLSNNLMALSKKLLILPYSLRFSSDFIGVFFKILIDFWKGLIKFSNGLFNCKTQQSIRSWCS